jgi:GH15 family glucan-1,4-alpha-glucosidase
MGFLPANYPRVVSTVRAIEQQLTIDGFVHRFLASETLDNEDLPLGEFEGAFLPCTFWLATTYAMSGRIEDAEKILNAAERIAGGPGVFAEEIDARNQTFLGNTPLLFAQVEYVRTILTVGAQSGSAR